MLTSPPCNKTRVFMVVWKGSPGASWEVCCFGAHTEEELCSCNTRELRGGDVGARVDDVSLCASAGVFVGWLDVGRG